MFRERGRDFGSSNEANLAGAQQQTSEKSSGSLLASSRGLTTAWELTLRLDAETRTNLPHLTHRKPMPLCRKLQETRQRPGLLSGTQRLAALLRAPSAYHP